MESIDAEPFLFHSFLLLQTLWSRPDSSHRMAVTEWQSPNGGQRLSDRDSLSESDSDSKYLAKF